MIRFRPDASHATADHAHNARLKAERDAAAIRTSLTVTDAACLEGRWILLRHGDAVDTVFVGSAELTVEQAIGFVDVFREPIGSVSVTYETGTTQVPLGSAVALASHTQVSAWITEAEQGRAARPKSTATQLFTMPASFGALIMFIAIGFTGQVMWPPILLSSVILTVSIFVTHRRRRAHSAQQTAESTKWAACRMAQRTLTVPQHMPVTGALDVMRQPRPRARFWRRA
jgi:hypothetical protein